MNERSGEVVVVNVANLFSQLEVYFRDVNLLVENVDRLLHMLDSSPETTEFLADRYGPLMWAIDHIKEARHALEDDDA